MAPQTPNFNKTKMQWLGWGGSGVVLVSVLSWYWHLPGLMLSVLGLILCLWWFSHQAQQNNRRRVAVLDQEIRVLQRVQANKDELLAVVSHEMRTPMNVVLGLHPRIREGLGQDDAALALLDQLHGATNHLLDVFNSILDASQAHARGSAKHETSPSTWVNTDKMHSLTQHRWRFLVVDDSAVNLLVVRLMLQKLFPQAQIDVTDSAVDAMAYLDTTQPDLMMVDLWMPDLDGYALARWVRHHPRKALTFMPILALTGEMSPEDAQRRGNSGINDVIYKPIDERQLSARLCQWLETLHGEAHTWG